MIPARTVSLVTISTCMSLLCSLVILPSDIHASVHTYLLKDHSAGNQNPPPYGLRVDNIFQGDGYGGVTTFSLSHPNSNVIAKVDDVANTMHIYGTATGGVDSGTGYSAEVEVYIDFTYTGLSLAGYNPLNPNIMLNGLPNSMGPSSGTVTVTQEISNVTPNDLLGNSYGIKSKANGSGNQFNFKNNTHRGHTGLNGWGWVSLDSGYGGTHDWLFTAEVVPEPGTMAIWSIIAIAGVAIHLRQKKTEKS